VLVASAALGSGRLDGGLEHEVDVVLGEPSVPPRGMAVPLELGLDVLGGGRTGRGALDDVEDRRAVAVGAVDEVPAVFIFAK
jgi:hypothetical protein